MMSILTRISTTSSLVVLALSMRRSLMYLPTQGLRLIQDVSKRTSSLAMILALTRPSLM